MAIAFYLPRLSSSLTWGPIVEAFCGPSIRGHFLNQHLRLVAEKLRILIPTYNFRCLPIINLHFLLLFILELQNQNAKKCYLLQNIWIRLFTAEKKCKLQSVTEELASYSLSCSWLQGFFKKDSNSDSANFPSFKLYVNINSSMRKLLHPEKWQFFSEIVSFRSR